VGDFPGGQVTLVRIAPELKGEGMIQYSTVQAKRDR
jgi:hypothetical protein